VISNAPSQVTTAAINDSTISGNFLGVDTQAPIATGTAQASVINSAIVNNGYGVAAEVGTGTSRITIGSSLVTGNATSGLFQTGTATLESLGNNIVRQNGANTTGTITVVSGT
jgi:hypothetical protein